MELRYSGNITLSATQGHTYIDLSTILPDLSGISDGVYLVLGKISVTENEEAVEYILQTTGTLAEYTIPPDDIYRHNFVFDNIRYIAFLPSVSPHLFCPISLIEDTQCYIELYARDKVEVDTDIYFNADVAYYGQNAFFGDLVYNMSDDWIVHNAADQNSATLDNTAASYIYVPYTSSGNRQNFSIALPPGSSSLLFAFGTATAYVGASDARPSFIEFTIGDQDYLVYQNTHKGSQTSTVKLSFSLDSTAIGSDGGSYISFGEII